MSINGCPDLLDGRDLEIPRELYDWYAMMINNNLQLRPANGDEMLIDIHQLFSLASTALKLGLTPLKIKIKNVDEWNEALMTSIENLMHHLLLDKI